MHRFLFLSFLLFVVVQQLTAQSKRGNIGVFGEGLALDFNFSPPTVYPIPVMDYFAFEGSASICDNEGKLLFSTNGVAVRDRNFLFFAELLVSRTLRERDK